MDINLSPKEIKQQIDIGNLKYIDKENLIDYIIEYYEKQNNELINKISDLEEEIFYQEDKIYDLEKKIKDLED